VGMHHNGYNVGATVAWDEVAADPAANYPGPFENPHPSWSFYSTLQTYANKIAVAGYDTPLCVTRFGWAVAEDLTGSPQANFEFALDNTLAEQQQWLLEAIELMQERGYVWLAFIWNLNAGPEAAFDPLNNSVAYSLIRPEYAFAPAWLAIEAMDFRDQPRP
jgi:polysaccharide biosynthesis protein PslG